VQQLPEIGDGVRIPWGLDTAKGEVVDLLPPNHAVVEVPVVDASGEVIDTTVVRLRLDALEALPPWRIVKSKSGPPQAGADASKSWWVEAARNGDVAKTEVRVSGSLAASSRTNLPADTRRALSTQGKAAVEKFSHRFRLPRVIVVGTTGVFELHQ